MIDITESSQIMSGLRVMKHIKVVAQVEANAKKDRKNVQELVRVMSSLFVMKDAKSTAETVSALLIMEA